MFVQPVLCLFPHFGSRQSNPIVWRPSFNILPIVRALCSCCPAMASGMYLLGTSANIARATVHLATHQNLSFSTNLSDPK